MVKQTLPKRVVLVLLAISILSVALPGMPFVSASAGDLPDVSAKPMISAEIGEDLQKEVQSTLQTYTLALSGEKAALQNSPSAEINNLVNERRDFYGTFFQLGLHSTLGSIESKFVFDANNAEASSQISRLSAKQLAVRIDEMVTLAGKYNAKPEEYPMNQAAQWALKRTNNKRVQQALKDYIQNATEDIKVSSGEEGFEVTFVLRHSLVVEESAEGMRIVKDVYTDISVDNPNGIDNVIWDNQGQLIRNLPDYTDFVDYSIYNKSVEELGKEMLSLYEKIYSAPAIQSDNGINALYSRSNAATYINKYTSNTTKKCSLFSDLLSDESKWNSNYSKKTCADCANYVSQALLSGGLPTDGTWYKDSTAWVNTYKLNDWILGKGYGYGMCIIDPSILSKGDLGLTGDMGHVVMVGAVGPTRYSGHTNDRLKYTWSTSSLPNVIIITY